MRRRFVAGRRLTRQVVPQHALDRDSRGDSLVRESNMDTCKTQVVETGPLWVDKK